MTSATATKKSARKQKKAAAVKAGILVPVLLVAGYLFLMIGGVMKNPTAGEFSLGEFSKIPVIEGGRIKPVDSLARVSLTVISGRSSVVYNPEDLTTWQRILARFTGEETEYRRISALEWMADVMFRPEAAERYEVFLVQHPELLALLGDESGSQRRFSVTELAPYLERIQEQAVQAGQLESQERNPFQRDVLKLANRLQLYTSLRFAVWLNDEPSFADEIKRFEQTIAAVRSEVEQSGVEETLQTPAVRLLNRFLSRFRFMEARTDVLTVPPNEDLDKRELWQDMGAALLAMRPGQPTPEAITAWASMRDAYADGKPQQLTSAAAEYNLWLNERDSKQIDKRGIEVAFNQAGLFYNTAVAYVLIFLLACYTWLRKSPTAYRSAFWLLVAAFVIHTIALGIRMYLQDRPPVTNLYSSAVFVGWAAVGIGIVFERIFKDGVGMVAASSLGFATLIVAHHLSADGDTIEMMRAVLDSNFWLATHVVIITLGYSATFLAGFLAIIFIVRGLFTTSLTATAAKSLEQMAYGVICFALLFSFVGTVLGGIWADQSWGRFWGWDPKENGALMIVIWNAVILHAKWTKWIAAQGLMVMALMGNIITSFSWFGTNMLGIGLHSYGFMDSQFPYLLGFILSQVILMALGSMPKEIWRSKEAFKQAGGKRQPEAVGAG